MNKSADNSFAIAGGMSNNGRYGFQIENFNSNPYRNSLSHDSDTQYLRMPTRLNLHENGLRRYTHLHKLREKEEMQKRKEHTTYGTTE